MRRLRLRAKYIPKNHTLMTVDPVLKPSLRSPFQLHGAPRTRGSGQGSISGTWGVGVDEESLIEEGLLQGCCSIPAMKWGEYSQLEWDYNKRCSLKRTRQDLGEIRGMPVIQEPERGRMPDSTGHKLSPLFFSFHLSYFSFLVIYYKACTGSILPLGKTNWNTISSKAMIIKKEQQCNNSLPSRYLFQTTFQLTDFCFVP